MDVLSVLLKHKVCTFPDEDIKASNYTIRSGKQAFWLWARISSLTSQLLQASLLHVITSLEDILYKDLHTNVQDCLRKLFLSKHQTFPKVACDHWRISEKTIHSNSLTMTLNQYCIRPRRLTNSSISMSVCSYLTSD